jgi:flagellin-like protein
LTEVLTTSRAQSEPIGVILLVAVVTLVISVSGFYYLGALDTGVSPTTNVDSRVTTDQIRLTHDAGDVVATVAL